MEKSKRKEKSRVIPDSSAEHLCMVDKNLRVIWLDRAARELLGKNIVGKKCYVVFHKAKEPCEFCPALKTFKRRNVPKYGAPVTDPRGRREYFRCTRSMAFVAKKRKPAAIIEISRDVTSRETAGTLRESEEKERRLTEGCCELIYRKDRDKFFVTDVTGVVERFYGYTPREWFGDRSLREKSIHPEDRERVLRELAKAESDIKNTTIEYRIIKKDQSVIWVEDHISWEKDTKNNPVAMIGVMCDITRRKDAEKALYASREMFKEFSKKLMLLHEEEKKKISRDLHDETGQIVISLGASLNIIEKELKEGHIEKGMEMLNQKRALIQEIASRMKSMALTLRPPALDILGLPAVLREYFSHCTESCPLTIEFNENLKDVKLNEDIEITLYRIVQEAIYNVIKHASATKVKVDLIFTENRLDLSIEDNGKGFDVERYEKLNDLTKIGLRSIKERTDILSGNLSIDSTPEKGAKLTVVLPLDYTLWQPI